MNILIKGMKMPKVCADCPFWEMRYDPGYYNYEYCKALGKIFNEHSMEIDVFEERFNDCPLVEIITPHGRLIDADALFQDLREHNIPFNNDINSAINVAPTIVEAEE